MSDGPDGDEEEITDKLLEAGYLRFCRDHETVIDHELMDAKEIMEATDTSDWHPDPEKLKGLIESILANAASEECHCSSKGSKSR